MAGQETDTEKSAREPVQQDSSPDLEKSLQTPNILPKASSTAIRSVQHSLGKLSSASVRLYRCTWRRVSPVSVRLYRRSWREVRSRTAQVYQHLSPKLSSVALRLNGRTLSEAPSAAIRHAAQETVSAIVRLPGGDCLEVASLSIRLFQWISSLYVFICVTESFRSKITYDGRVRQIQPIMLTTLIYSSVAIVRFLLLILLKKPWASAWYIGALSSIPWDLSMTCLFIAKVVIFGVHSFECAASQSTTSAIQQYGDLRNMDVLELRTLHDNRPSHGAFIAAARDVCLVPSSVYVICGIAALSYVGSAILTAGQLLKYRKPASPVVDGQYPNHVEQAMPVDVLRPHHTIQRGRSLIEAEPPRLRRTPTSQAPRPPPGSGPQDPKYANLPAGLVESMIVIPWSTPEGAASTSEPDQHAESDHVPPRTSQETTTSLDPDHYMVSDGFRSCGRPPSYTSSRESSQGPPEYRSRPPSLHTVVLVGP